MKSNREIFQEKADGYLPCFIDSCTLHSTCLRWLVGQEFSTERINTTCVNPKNPKIGGDQCLLYRNSEKVRQAKGMMHFFDEMPRRMEVSIKQELIGIYTRKGFYEYRRGDRLITPEMQRRIAAVCRSYGWTAEPVYDQWVDEYLW